LSELISNTSPMQYLYQLDRLDILPALSTQVVIPPAVVDELAVGRSLGLHLPDPLTLGWVEIRRPISVLALPLITDLGPGETEVLMLGLETSQAVVILDDALGRQVAETLNLHLTGTLGLLLDAKKAGLIPAVKPLLDQLQALGFHLANYTRVAVLHLAGEDP